jgi:predicted regulator of amino acid metabolism with ACT domain
MAVQAGIEMGGADQHRERALVAVGDELTALLHHADAEVLLALLDNPALEETQLCILLERKNLPGEILEEVARRKPRLRSYRVKKALAFHPRTPRLVTLRLLRDLYLMDLVQLTLLAGIPTELKRNAEDQLVSRLPQLPLGQKITLARRGPARLAGALLAEGHAQIVTIVLDNAYLTEAQVLKVLSREKIPPGVVRTISQHRKWSISYNVRLALVRHPLSPLATVLAYLPELTVSDLRELASPGIVSESVRKYLQAEVQRRIRAGEKSAQSDNTPGPGAASNQN